MKKLPLHQRTKRVRDHISSKYDEFVQSRIKENFQKLMSSVFAIENTELAIDAYRIAKWPKKDGMRYLRVYGLLQAMVVQQNAILHLRGVLVGENYKVGRLEKDAPAIWKIRDYRNAVAGHPTEHTRWKKVNGQRQEAVWQSFDLRGHLGKWRFFFVEIESNDTSKLNTVGVNVKDIMRTQRDWAVQHLDEITSALI